MRSIFINYSNARAIVFCLLASLVACKITIAQVATGKYEPKAVKVKPEGASGFPMDEVKLLQGPFKESQDAEAKYLLSLDIDRLLAPYLIEAGIATKAVGYPGWETETLPGVALCFYLSGTSRLYATTGEKVFLNNINYILTRLALCQARNNGFLLGTKGGQKILTRVEKEGFFPEFGNWQNGEATPYYSMEKLFSGLRDVYRICHIQKALRISIDLGNWLQKHMSFISDVELQKLMAIEYGGMNWVLADLYADTNDKRFLELSRRWQDNITVFPAVNGNDVLNGKHANMQFPKFYGLAARYPYSGNAGDLQGAKFFWDNVVNHRSYVTGGNSESEYFGPRDSLSKRLTPYTEENCNEYNMLRLTSLLNNIEPSVKYADYIERTLFNHILASQDPSDGRICYYLPLMPGAERVYQSLYESFKCCVCSAMDSYTRHAEYIYTHTPPAVFINLFIASELNFKEKGMIIKQETSFPDNDISTLQISCSKPLKTVICIRNPYWANNEVSIKINGILNNTSPSSDGYFHINRTWKNNDVVEIKLPMKLRTEAMPDDKNMIAFFYGPVLLAGSFNSSEADALVNQNAAPAIVAGNVALDSWLTPTVVPLVYTTTVLKPGNVEVMPLFRKKTGSYSIYWQKLSGTEWAERLSVAEQKKEDEKQLDLITTDKVNACDEAAETSHHLTGTSNTGKGNFGILNGDCWRVSGTGAFGYELAVSSTGQNRLYCKYMGRLDYEKWNCRITINGIGIDTLAREKDDAYPVGIWEKKYLIPMELTNGKSSVQVMFEPLVKDKIQMPRLMEIRTLKN